MRTPDEARASIERAVTDRAALRISDAELKAVKERFHRRMMQVKKQSLLANAARMRTRDLEGIKPLGRRRP